MAKLLISANGYEDASNYGLYWARLMADELRSQGHTIAFIENGSKYDIDTELLSGNYDLVYHTGHGCEYITTTYEYEDLFWVKGSCGYGHNHDDNEVSILPEKKVYLLSCLCGTALVPYIGNLGGSIGGYITEFSWVAKPPYIPGNDNDIYSKWFFDTANTFFKELANGNTPQQAYERTLTEYQAAISYWENSDDPLAPLCVTLLIQDMRALVVYHNTERLAIMNQPIKIPITLSLLTGGILLNGYLINKKRGK